ncbi:MAG: hypothetical protein ABW026_03500 [Microvirga sp.]
MDKSMVEEVARRLAEFEVARLHKDHRPEHPRVEIVTELHRAKARIAISTIDQIRRRGKPH